MSEVLSVSPESYFEEDFEDNDNSGTTSHTEIYNPKGINNVGHMNSVQNIHHSIGANIIIRSFEDLKITTQTACFTMKGNVHLEKVFYLLPFLRVELPVPKRKTKKYKIPHVGPPGSLLSIRYQGKTRGIVRSEALTHFSHSITIDATCYVKMVSVKLAPNSLHMCGLTSKDMPKECASYIVLHLENIQGWLDYQNNNKDMAEK